jgi:desulfoferrodoxin (superoxide reductase-like protein)
MKGVPMRAFWAALFILISASCVFADPPKDITLKISATKLEIFVLHPSDYPTQHYIKTINVYLNEKKIIRQEFCAQDKEGLTAIYLLPGLKKGDLIKVFADCSIYGSMQKQIVSP